MSIYMYIDYNGYFYPKVLFSFEQFEFENSLSSILLNNTGFYGKEEKYKNCIIWEATNKNKWFEYSPEEVFQYLNTLSTFKYKGKYYDIIHK